MGVPKILKKRLHNHENCDYFLAYADIVEVLLPSKSLQFHTEVAVSPFSSSTYYVNYLIYRRKFEITFW